MPQKNEPRPSETECLVYTVPEAGALLGLTKNASYEAAKRGDLPTLRIGKLLKVPKAALHTMINSADRSSLEKADAT